MNAWDGISEFIAVAERQNFTHAARQLGISVAQVSRQVTALEEKLGTQLFYRTTRKVSVTEAGQIYYQHCRQLLDGLDEAERARPPLELLADHPTLMKRPLIVDGDSMYLGWTKDVQAALAG